MKTKPCSCRAALAAPLLLVPVLLAGCSQETLQSAAKDTAKNAVIVAREAKRAEKKAGPQIQKLKLGGRVLAAITANQKLPPTIRVDASETGVTLRGSVQTSEQKKLAETIARQTLKDEYSVQNDLTVKP